MHKSSSFLTLTYNEKNIPAGHTLKPRDLQLFWKRLRKVVPRKIRYYAVGEYGDKTQRPHYHAAVYGLSVLEQHYAEYAWDKGHVYLGELNADSAQYVSGYVVKKLTKKEDKRLNGRYPEFSRMSRNPGIGAKAVEVLAEALEEQIMEDVPIVIRFGGKKWPLGRYIRGKLRQTLGRSENTPETVRKKHLEELQRVFQDDLKNPKNTSLSLKEIRKRKMLGRINSMEKREKIHGQRKTL